MPTAPQTTDELYQALQENQQRPYGRTRTVTAEELVDAAEQFEDTLALVRTLFELQEAYTYGAEPRKSPVVFARLLTLFDEQPDVFDERLRHLLFWRFKWVANALRALPEIPLPSLRQWLTEMRDRYQKAALDLQPYYGQAYQLAAHLGEDTDLAYELWAARSRSRLSDCEACEICERARYHLAAGDDERALAIWEPVLSGQDSCQKEPARSVSYALLPLLRTGRTDRARELHLAGYRGCRRNPSTAGEVGRHLEFCALTSNEARGLELLAENRTLFDEVDSPLDLLDFLTGVEVLLQRVERLGHGDLPAAGFAGRTWTVATLRAEAHDRADGLAARFDARLRADLLVDEANIAHDKDEHADAADLFEEAAGLYEEAGLPGHAALCRAHGLFTTTEAATEHGDADAKADRLTATHEALVRLHESAPHLTPHQEARLLRLRAIVLGMRLQTTGGEADQAAAVFAEVDLLHEFATRHDIPSQIAGALLLRASTHAITGDLPEAVTQVDALLEKLAADGPAWHLPRAHELRGRLHLALGEVQAAHTTLTEGLRRAADWPAGTVDTARLHADLAEAAMHLGRPEEALRHLTRSAETDLRHGSRTDAYCTFSNAAQLSLELGRVEDSIALLDSLLADPDVTAGRLDDRLVAQLRLTRARALHSADDVKAATAEYVTLAAESAEWDDDPGSHAMIASETAVLLALSGEFGRAREAVDQALAAHAKAPRYEQLSACLREVARVQAQQQGADGLPHARAFLADAARIADEARAADHQSHGRSLDSALAYEHGRVNAYGGAYDAALTALDQALALLGEPGADQAHAAEWAECVRLAAAVEGIYLDRPAPARARLDQAVTTLTTLGHHEETQPLTELATSLLKED
ncbi:MAG: hypothetical protein H5T76_34270 [Streptomyces sp.]|nr:hypothetical protein [Streptomyces sp.]